MTKDNDHDGKDRRPTIARDDPSPRTDPKDSLKNATETMDEPAAGSPKADDQARQS